MGGATCERARENNRRMDRMRLALNAWSPRAARAIHHEGGSAGPYGMMPMSIMGGSLQRVDISYPILSFSILSAPPRLSAALFRPPPAPEDV